jgi:hypothetical protein
MIKPTVGMMVRQLVDEALEIDLLIPKGATGTITAIETDKGGNVDGVVVRFDQPIKNLENNQMFWTRDHFHPTPFLEAFWKEMELVKKVKLRFYAVKLDGTDVFSSDKIGDIATFLLTQARWVSQWGVTALGHPLTMLLNPLARTEELLQSWEIQSEGGTNDGNN